MPAIPLGLESYKRANGFEPEVQLRNLLLEEDKSGASPDNFMRISRPGLSRVIVAGTARGIHRQPGFLGGAYFVVIDTDFTVYTNAFSIKGVVLGDDLTAFATAVDRVFTLGGGVITSWDGTTYATIAMPDGRICTDIDTLNGYLIAGCPDGRFYWLEPGQAAFDALNFATAESQLDGIVAVRRVGDEVWMFGTDTIEPWQTTGDLAAPFSRAAGRMYDRGCLARDTVRRFDNSVLWVGDDAVVYRGGAVPQRISEHGIEERIRNRAGAINAWEADTDGHKLYVLNVPSQGTLVFDAATGKWSQFGEGDEMWMARLGHTDSAGTMAGGVGALWRLDPDVARDDGAAFTCIATANVPVPSRAGRQDSFTIATGSATNFTLKVRWKDGQDDFPDYYEELEARAPYDIVNIYRLGMPEQPMRSFQVVCNDPVKVRFSGALMNEGWK